MDTASETSAVAFTIEGEPASKANSRALVHHGARARFIKSPEALDFERAALLQIPVSARRMIEGPVRVTLRIFYASQRRDLDESLVLDVMQARYSAGGRRSGRLARAGVFVNDRQVREKHIYHGVDRARPRVEVLVEPMGPTP